MQFLKTLYNCVLALVLFVTVSGFTGLPSYTIHFKNAQTEILVTSKSDNSNVVNYNDIQQYISQYVTVNQFTEFNFKGLLNFCHFNYSVTLKSQKQAIFQFVDANSILEQNLIAYKNTSHTYNAIIK